MTPTHARTFNAETLLPLPALAGPVVDYQPAVRIYAQGEAADTILYIQQGCVKLSVLTPTGKEALVGMLGGGEFFGEGPLAGQRVRLATATAVTVSTIRVIPERDMNRLIHEQPAVSDRFIAHLLARTTRLEADLVDHLFSGCEKRLARELLLLAGHGTPGGPRRMLPRISQEGLAEMVGTSRSRVNLYMNQFRRRGFIDYHDGMIAVHETLTRVVLDDAPVSDRDDGRTGPPEVRVESRPRPGRPSAGRVSNRLDVATLPETSPRRDMNRPHPLTSEINAPTVAPYWRVRTSAVSSRARILVVTRQAEIARALGAALQGCAYDVAQADSDALARLRGAPPDLIVTTEVRLLDMRDTPQHPLTAGPMPAILVVATGQTDEGCVNALRQGADDYVIYPLPPAELVARIEVLLRRVKPPTGDVIEVGDLRVDLGTREVTVRGHRTRLRPTEFDLFVYLLRRPGTVQPHRALLAAIWGPAVQLRPHYVRMCVAHLRQQIESQPACPRYLITERAIGYRAFRSGRRGTPSAA